MMSVSRPAFVQRNLTWFAILALVLVPLGGWMYASQDHKGQGAAHWVGFAFVLAGLAASSVAMRSQYRRVTHRPEAELDERELALRHRARATAFQIYGVITVLGCLYLVYAPRLHAPLPAGEDWFWVMVALGNLFGLLPIVILLWVSDPLAPNEDEE